MVKLSVVIITFNEERHLARCLDSVKEIADEIVIVDSSSTDGTVAIAKRYNAKIVDQPFIGYGQQKNFANSQASNDWILSLDADEVLTPELIQTLLQIRYSPNNDAYEIPRITNYCGQWIRHCGWYPDHQTRLFNRTKGRWEEQMVHEYWKLNNSKAKKGLAKGDILHYSFDSISSHLKKIEKYTELAALDAVKKGKKAGLLKIVFSPLWHFISEYFLRLGFLDGFYGFIICRLSAYSAFIKYSKIRAYSQKS